MLRILPGKRRRKHQINSAHFLSTKEAEGERAPNDLRSLPTMPFPHTNSNKLSKWTL